MSRLMGMIRVAKSQLGMDEEIYRDFLYSTIRKRSLKDSSSKEQWRVVEALKSLGFKPQPKHKGKMLVNDPQARLIRHLWLTMSDCGIVRNRAEEALDMYVRRITGQTLKTANVKQCQIVIETLKRWLDRCEDPASRERCLAILRDEVDAPDTINGLALAGDRHDGRTLQ